MKKYTLLVCLLLTSLLENVQGAYVRNRRRTEERKAQPGKALKITPVNANLDPTGKEQHSRRLMNGGGIFIVSHSDDEGIQWCLDAVEGISSHDGLYPGVGIRPCAFNASPTEQLFYPSIRSEGVIKISSAFDWDACLLFEEPVGSVDRLSLGPCDSELSDFLLDNPISDELGVSDVGTIRVATNTDLCLTYQGNHIRDEDRMELDFCEDSDKFKFGFQTGYYYIDAGPGCVAVRNHDASNRNRVVLDGCYASGFASHWRLDGDGLLHSRMDDGYCMQAVSRKENAPIRISPCDKDEDNQLFTWPQGFEGQICLKDNQDLCISPHGQTQVIGDNIVLRSHDESYGYSGDAVARVP